DGGISAKMIDSPLRRQHLLAALCVLLALAMALASEKDAKWMAPLRQYGYTAQHLKNRVEHGEYTTFELGTPNYRILNPEDEPEYITADQPHYQEMLRQLTSGQSGADTIDVAMAGEPTQSPSSTTPGAPTTPMEVTTNRATDGWEKVRKRSSMEGAGEELKELVDAEAADELSLHPKIQVYAGAKPFQSRVANLN
ncbi:hypothetical protein KR018_002532, partial [Drosophila ironensis]